MRPYIEPHSREQVIDLLIAADELRAEIEAVTDEEAGEACGLLFGASGAVGLGISGPPVAGVTAGDLMGELAA